MRKLCLKIHRWLALPLGIFMSILCFTGFLLLVVKDVSGLFGIETRDIAFHGYVKQMHRWLFMMPADPHGGLSAGRVIVAVSSMCMAIVLLTGVVVWWPKSKKMLKNRLSVTTSKGFRRFVYDTHVSLGTYVFVFLFLMALTGPVFSFGWYRQGMSKLFAQPMPQKEMKQSAPQPQSPPATTATGAFTADSARQPQPQAQSVTPSPSNGNVASQPNKKKKYASSLFHSLHMGYWGGWFSRLFYALAALIGGFLPISGYYMWWKRTHAATTRKLKS